MNKHSESQFISKALRISVCTVAFMLPAALQAAGSSRSPTKSFSSAVDAKGVRHYANDYPNGRPPWVVTDALKLVGPEYPYSERASWHQGSGDFRLMLDLKTGALANVIVVKSTGFRTLDESAISAFRKSRWKPGKWKEIDIPVTFEMASGPRALPPGAIRLPRS